VYVKLGLTAVLYPPLSAKLALIPPLIAPVLYNAYPRRGALTEVPETVSA